MLASFRWIMTRVKWTRRRITGPHDHKRPLHQIGLLLNRNTECQNPFGKPSKFSRSGITTRSMIETLPEGLEDRMPSSYLGKQSRGRQRYILQATEWHPPDGSRKQYYNNEHSLRRIKVRPEVHYWPAPSPEKTQYFVKWREKLYRKSSWKVEIPVRQDCPEGLFMLSVFNIPTLSVIKIRSVESTRRELVITALKIVLLHIWKCCKLRAEHSTFSAFVSSTSVVLSSSDVFWGVSTIGRARRTSSERPFFGAGTPNSDIFINRYINLPLSCAYITPSIC